MYRIGVIGCGFVGKAVASGFSLHVDSVKVHDIDPKLSIDDLKSTIELSDFIFLCLPTPNFDGGSQDVRALLTAMYNIEEYSSYSKVIIVKSTVLPGTTRELSSSWPRHMFIHNPEFLTARTARLDFNNPTRIILGGKADEGLELVANLYRHRFGPKAPIHCCGWEEAELVKYFTNAFYATKVAFSNEMAKIAKVAGVDYKTVKNLWVLDPLMVDSHCDVPGHDGKKGYGGACLPKDTKAIHEWLRSYGEESLLLEAVIDWGRFD